MERNGTECVCGADSGIGGGKLRIIFPCAGVANVGQVSNLAAIQLTKEGYGNATCIALLGSADRGISARIAGADEIVILDGCPAQCGKKIADLHGVTVVQHIVITDLGIENVHSNDYSADDIEKVVSAAWEGKGRAKDK